MKELLATFDDLAEFNTFGIPKLPLIKRTIFYYRDKVKNYTGKLKPTKDDLVIIGGVTYTVGKLEFDFDSQLLNCYLWEKE